MGIAKSVVAASAVAVGSTMALSGGALGTGQCTNVKQCSIWGDDYACISVDTKMAVKKASMCVPTNNKAGICSGLTSGLCPSFSAIPSLNNIETVCAFFPPTDGNECVNKSIEN